MKSNEVNEPVKLSSVLELFDDGEEIDISIKLKSRNYVYLRGEIGALRELDTIQRYFVVGMGTKDPDTEEEILYILAIEQ